MRRTQNKPASRRGKPDMIRHYHPAKECTLMAFLIETLKDKSRTTIKSYLAHRQVAVNGRPTTQFDTPLHPTDEVSINFDRQFNYFKHPMLHIVYEDDQIIVVDKAAGLLSVGTDRDKDKTAYRILSDYVKRSDLRNKIFVVHRLDRETSGLMMFAKTPQAQTRLQQDWDNAVLDRRYLAVVEGRPEKESGELRSYLAENSAMNVYSTDPENGKLAITRYRVLQSRGRYSLVELELLTGRKNQIRVHMQEFGYPVAGDKKYGAHTNPARRLMLHACKLQFVHPMTKENMLFETPVPAKFKMMFNS
jgi:23S rRNA pseudouridine1911/1915/1917 synthase